MNDISDILPRFRNVHPSGSGYMARCPAHEDGTASLSIGTGTDGRILLHCMAGCSPAAVTAAAGITMADLFPQSPAASAKSASKEIVAVYPYHDETGALLYEVIRFKPKDFRQRHPDGRGGHIWDMKGVRRVLYRLPELLAAKQAGSRIYACEGEKDVDNLRALGFEATCNVGGAGKWDASYTTALAGAHVVIIADRDEPGQKHAALVAGALHGKAASVRVIEMPDRAGAKVKDASDWIAAGGTAAELDQIVGATPEWTPAATGAGSGAGQVPAAPATETSDILVLPSNAGADNGASIKESAQKIFGRIAQKLELFNRGGNVMRLGADEEGRLRLDTVGDAAFCSTLEAYGRLHVWREFNGEAALKPCVCNKEVAARLLACQEVELLPPIRGLVAAPVLANVDGSPVLLGKGYHPHAGGILVTGGKTPPEIPLGEAVEVLRLLVAEFDFTTPADRSRALASFVTPALRLGGWLNDRVPIDAAEADQSQAGKGFRQELVFSLYNEMPALCGQKRGGVGSLDESIQSAMLTGRPFVQLDNMRGRLDSPFLEMVLTAGGSVGLRVPHKGDIQADARHFLFFITSNGVEATVDLLNRASIVRIKKREGYRFRQFPEGALNDHLRANQPYFLGAVFAVIREWARAGRRESVELRHDFRRWAGVLDWIVQNILHEAPLLDGHRMAQERASNPALAWLRAVALAVRADGKMGEPLTASALAELSEEHGIDLPGLRGTGDDDRRKHTGVLLARAIKKGAEFVEIDGMTVTRKEGERYDEAHQGMRPTKIYFFAVANPSACDENQAQTATTATTAIRGIKTRETTLFYNNYTPCGSDGSGSKNPGIEAIPQPAYPGEEF
jgi:5S rRNA maturation endonuclease (ribonuclease M5)